MALAVAIGQGDSRFYYDSGAYWHAQMYFTQGEGFSLLNFAHHLRGYAFPLMTLGLANLAALFDLSNSLVVKAFNSTVFALIAAVLAPKLAELVWPERQWGVWRRITLGLLLIVFWRGYLDYPLTDFPALALVLLALVALAQGQSLAWMLAAGLAVGAAVNLRPAYVVLIPAVVMLAAVDWRRPIDWQGPSRSRRALAAILAVVGFAAVSLPQSLAMHRHHGSWNFVPGTAAGLSRLQLNYGLQMQRYDTFIGDGDASNPRLVYHDPVGEQVLTGAGGQITGLGEYLGLVAAHPVDMGGVLGRHLLNGLDQRYSTPYLKRFNSKDNLPLRAIGFLLVFLALARIAWPSARRTLGSSRWRYLLGLLACGMPALVSAVETRFMLPVVIAAWVVVLTPGWRDVRETPLVGRRRVLVPVAILGGILLATVAVLYVVGNATDHLRAEPS